MSDETFRWIAYYQYSIPGNQSFELRAVESKREAAEWFDEFDDNGRDAATATLYAFTPENWELAGEFERIGCPFDYPDYVIERGPRGGLKFQRC